MADDTPKDASACPVDHTARAAWASASQTPPLPSASCDSRTLTNPPPSRPKLSKARLDTTRQVSSIPRADAPATPAAPANAERDSPADAATGNWVYPSEQMFFDAMRRKQHNPVAADMRAIIPIHNAVNERAWREIKVWEAARGGEKCGGPKLVSFAGDSAKLSPRARWNALWGYSRPFDRHDWVVDRCGTRVEYVIDFYKGKESGNAPEGLSFYLDVRPKLNTWEGVRMRAARLVGL